jgi:murein DD-endopeptidase MepM/ murein hydrolase activator NlpD
MTPASGVLLAHSVWDHPAAIPSETPTRFAAFQTRVQRALADQVTPLRLASHLAVLLVAGAVLLFSRVELPEWDFQLVAMPTESANSDFGSVAARVGQLFTASGTVNDAGDALQPQIVPFTIIPERTRNVIQVYTVQPGDTVLAIAAAVKLAPETLLWSNPTLEQNADLLSIGDQIRIPPMDGVLHKVAAGDSLSALATRFKVSTEQVVGYEANGLKDVNDSLIIGTDLFFPGGSKPLASSQAAGYSLSYGSAPLGAEIGSGNFSWPSAGSISQEYWSGHPGVDIAGRAGAPVKAADGGYVSVAGGGWNGGYGNQVIIDHGNGFATLYAHMNSIFVRPGESIAAGQQIGTVGNTGNSTGPHLHFEILYQGYARNPYSYLP